MSRKWEGGGGGRWAKVDATNLILDRVFDWLRQQA